MRIGINALFLLPGCVGGTEIYLRQLLIALAEIDAENDYVVFSNRETGLQLTPLSPRFTTVLCRIGATRRALRIVYEQTVLPRLLAKQCIDVLLNPGFTAPYFAGCPQVTVFHDLQHKIYPQFFRAAELPFWRFLLWLAALRSARTIAVSEVTARSFSAHYPEYAQNTAVVPHGVDREFFRIGERRGNNKTRPFILSVSTLHPHKNIARLLKAFAAFRADGNNYRLVLAGLRGNAASAIERGIADLKLSDCVTMTGWVPRPELYRLYEDCDAFIAPSLHEGFGLTLLEALAAGIPTACSSLEVFDPMCGDAARRFDPLSEQSLVQALTHVTGDAAFRNRAAMAGPACARAFDWHTTASMTLKVISQAFQENAKTVGLTPPT